LIVQIIKNSEIRSYNIEAMENSFGIFAQDTIFISLLTKEIQKEVNEKDKMEMLNLLVSTENDNESTFKLLFNEVELSVNKMNNDLIQDEVTSTNLNTIYPILKYLEKSIVKFPCYQKRYESILDKIKYAIDEYSLNIYHPSDELKRDERKGDKYSNSFLSFRLPLKHRNDKDFREILLNILKDNIPVTKENIRESKWAMNDLLEILGADDNAVVLASLTYIQIQNSYRNLDEGANLLRNSEHLLMSFNRNDDQFIEMLLSIFKDKSLDEIETEERIYPLNNKFYKEVVEVNRGDKIRSIIADKIFKIDSKKDYFIKELFSMIENKEVFLSQELLKDSALVKFMTIEIFETLYNLDVYKNDTEKINILGYSMKKDMLYIVYKNGYDEFDKIMLSRKFE